MVKTTSRFITPVEGHYLDFIREALLSTTYSLEIALRRLIQFIDSKQYCKID
jgi:hypothetical protein